MGRAELAEAVCAWLWSTTGKRYDLDAHTIARYERGVVRWPCAAYRAGLRHVLGTDDDSAMGFTPPQRRPGTTLLSTDVSWISASDGGGVGYPGGSTQAVDALADLTAADLTDNPQVNVVGWGAQTAPSVITGYLFDGPLRPDQPGVVAEASGNVAARIRATARYLMDLDFRFGGGHTRKMLLLYWTTEIIPALRQSYSELERREVFAAAADAAEVLGWAAYDAGRHGTAQRYFVLGLRLASEADDHLMGGQILANLSHQANYLGNVTDAIQFARAAQSATTGRATATVTAMFLAMEARALASVRDTRGCAEALHRAEQMFERSNPGQDPEWISYFDALELAGEAAHCFRDLGQARETRQFATDAIDPDRTPPRTRAFIGMVDAAGALAAGHVDEAVSVAKAAVSQAGSLRSGRYLRYLADFHRSLTEQHATHTAVREFSELVHTAYPTDSG